MSLCYLLGSGRVCEGEDSCLPGSRRKGAGARGQALAPVGVTLVALVTGALFERRGSS